MMMAYRKIVSLLLAVGCLSIPAQVFGWNCWSNDCCEYQGPLCQGSYSVLVKGGVAPTHWTKRGTEWLTVPALFPLTNPVIDIGTGARFRDSFDTPWVVGADISYNVSDSAQVFLEFDYREADRKSQSFTFTNPLTGLPVTVDRNFNRFESWAWYLGARYYFSRSWFCDRLAPFLGFKAGWDYKRSIRFSYTLGDIDITSTRYFHHQNSPSVGALLGFDFWIWDSLSAVVTFEAVASTGLRGNRNVVLYSAPGDPAGAFGFTNLSIGNTGLDVSYPITFGLRYTF